MILKSKYFFKKKVIKIDQICRLSSIKCFTLQIIINPHSFSCLPFQACVYHCHLHPLQAANCCRNSRLVVDEENCHVLVKQFHGNFRSKTLCCRTIRSVFRDVKWCFCQVNSFNPLTANLFNLNFRPLEVASRWRDRLLQVSENYSVLTKWSTFFKYHWLMSHFIFTIFKMWYLMCW